MHNIHSTNTGNSSVNVSTAHPKRLITARMHAARVSRAASAQRRSERAAARPANERRHATTGNLSAINAKQSDLVIKFGRGECPPYNDHVNFVQDPFNKKLYMIGGIRSGDTSNAPTNDFYCCNLSNMSWENLTYKLKQCNAYNPFRGAQAMKTIPQISLPGCMLLRMNGTSYIAMFGGYDYDLDRATSDILIVDPNKNEWWPLKFQGDGPVNPRINPAVIAINERIYVFGGYRKFGDDPQPYHSYNIAEHVGDGVWRWLSRDIPYSPLVPVGQVFQWACPVYNGTKILLTPGRLTGNEPIVFTQDNCFFYHTTNNRFQPATADVTGCFPPGIRWYSVFSSTSTPALSHPQGNAITSSTTHPDPLLPYSVIICAYVDVPNTDDIAPEIWHLRLSPEERIECLNIKQKIWDLDSDFQGCVYVDGRVRILGTAPIPTLEAGNRSRRMIVDDEDQYSNATWNTYLDIPLKR